MAAPRLALEALEARLVPVSWGNPWPSADPITLSFVPDGAATGAQPTDLFQTLQGQFPSGSWRYEMLRAFQTWALHANINLAVVADGGQPLGAAGRPQGDTRFGDIRLSAQPFTGEIYAMSSPFDPLAGTWSGDVRINSNVAFTGSNAVDLFTAMLQEAGHAFGLSNSDDLTSVMFESYDGVRIGLGPQDIARIQALYGTRHPDAYEGAGGNGSFASSVPLAGTTNPDGIVSWRVPRADLTTNSDVDVYRLQAPVMVGGMIFRLERSSTSLVTPRVTIYNHAMHPVAEVVSTDPLGGDLTIELDFVIPTATYYIKVEGAGGGVFDVGAYRLRTQTLPWFSEVDDFLPELGPSAEAIRDDAHSDDTFHTAEALATSSAPASAQFDYSLTAKLRDAVDVDYYRMQAPADTTGSRVLTVMAWGANGGVDPRVQVLDANENLLPARPLVNADGVLTFQIDVFTPGEAYVVRVEGDSVGDYVLGLDFNARPIHIDPWAERSLTTEQSTETGNLQVHRTGLFHFLLEGEGGATNTVALTVRDASGQVVAQLTVAGGSVASATLTLAAGAYRFEISGQGSSGPAFPGMNYRLRASRLSDPIGPRQDDPTEDPSSPPPPPPPGNPPESWYYNWVPPE